MRYNITGRHVEVTEGIRSAIESKFGKLSKYFTDDTEVRVRLGVQKEMQTIEVTIPTKVGLIRAEKSSPDMYMSIDLVQDIIEKQIKKYKSKLIDKKHSVQSFTEYFLNDNSEDKSLDIRIVKTKKFNIKPMDPVEACVQMELLNHNFYVFLNAETNTVNVVYKRHDDTYGMIEPEI